MHITFLRDCFQQVDTQEVPDGDMNISMTSSAFSTDSLENFGTNQQFSACKDRLQEVFDKNMKALIHFLEEGKCKNH